jgi:hypothetical protein
MIFPGPLHKQSFVTAPGWTTRGRRVIPLTLAIVTAACGSEDGTTASTAKPGLQVIAAPTATDTILAESRQALVVEVRDPQGKPIVGADVVFMARTSTDTTRGVVPSMAVCTAFIATCISPSVTDRIDADSTANRTDAQGRARATVQFGIRPGRGVVDIFVRNSTLRDSASFTVQTGAVDRVRFRSRDTTVMIGSTVPVNADLVDRAGNVVPGPITLSLRGNTSAATIDAVAQRASGVAFGSAIVVASGGGRTDSASVHVVPRARLAVWMFTGKLVRLINSDGTEPRDVLSDMDTSYGVFPRFSASRRQVIGLERGQGIEPIIVGYADTTSLDRRQVPTNLGFGRVLSPRLMADGSVLLAAFIPGGIALWRVDANGTAQRVRDLPGASIFDYGMLDISDDGQRVAYRTRSIDPAIGTGLRILDVATGTGRIIAPAAAAPRLSPDGSRVAFTDQVSEFGVSNERLFVMNTDGSARRMLTLFDFNGLGIAWSTDGAYLIASFTSPDGSFGLRMVRVSDGASVPMIFRSRTGQQISYLQPDWQ